MNTLAIDQGTTSTRALVVDAAGKVTPLASLPHRQIYPQAGWVEHDPEELIGNLRACLDAAGAVPDIGAIGLDNQGESCLAWNAGTGRAISPVIVWQDSRTASDIERLAADGLEATVLERAGLPLDPYFSASKLGWIMREIPEAARLAAKGQLRLGTTDAFFLDRLTGRFVTDVATASRTSLMNLATCGWDAELCALFGVPVDALPQIVPSTGDFGALDVGGRSVPLAASIVDQQASLYGHGCREAGDAKITFGTGAFALAVTGDLLRTKAGGPLPTVAWQKAGEAPTFALDGGVYSASSAVNWARGLGLFSDFAEIDAFDAPAAIDRGIAFVPALAGLACPHWDRSARGAWLGLSLDSSPADMMQALLEGVALRMGEVAGALQETAPLSAPVSIDGGMAANHYFCQFLADTLQREIIVSDQPELTAIGAAALAAEAVGKPFDFRRSGRRVLPGDAPSGRAERFAAARQAIQAYGNFR
ncbi:MAG: glycerol kinase [Alphaproteobacteria bacterium]|nr:glycerol kinase [Alphaproteobacteria bacterium]MBU0803948.1 glycerol kinase [Alphaproteobacteria bacterium]MBU0872755.1 glycerol kinase [Alphaproteobacteria bacterium]MBU1402875.1 glycerol kinase [Alphaproteobacteria bacterium]MBU1593517.1 glycerol kinase [Alphaproteobacteria bacterium]